MSEPTVTLEVFCLETGDRAEAEDERGMILAARTLCRDASTVYGVRPTIIFLVNGVAVVTRKGASI